MFAKTTTLVALFSVAARVAYAAPPACMLAAVNTCPNPGDIQEVCKSADKVEKYISNNCGGNEKAAMTAFKEVCDNAGVQVSTSTSSSAISSKTASASESDSSANPKSTIRVPQTASASDADSYATASGSVTSFITATGSASSGMMTLTPGGVLTASYGNSNGTAIAPSGTAAATGSSGSGSEVGAGSSSGAGSTGSMAAGPSASSSAGTGEFEGGAARFGMEAAGVAVLAVFGAVLMV